MVSAVLLLAEGAEEMEAVISIDTLRRGGVDVTVAGLGGDGPIKCSRDVYIKSDVSLADAMGKAPYDAVVIPGGMKGSENLAASPDVKTLLTEQEKSGRVIGAICAAPAVCLTTHGIGEGKNVTCYPSLKDRITSTGKYTFKEDRVVVDGQLITSQGPGTAFDFALALVEKLVSAEKRQNVAEAMLL
ncbi:Protein deglycase DJ-1zDJ-1 [Halocaridina rubra]|uniref:Protein deglycase DJ-1zDJ-1 n=1 Tax=Halocaridina rubra TaxID=373956 RepID=A0AAN9A6X7_HALRR